MRRVVLPILVVLLVVAALTHQVWLTAIGEALVTRDHPRPVDVILVLAGNSPYRARHAESLYAQGLAPAVIVSNELVSSHGVQATWLELRRAGLVRLTIPDEAIVPIAEVSSSTEEEAIHSRDLMLDRGWRSAILVTDPFHMRRAALTFRRVFEPAGLSVLASPAEDTKYGVANWWTDRNSIMRIGQEYMKFGYYVVTGRV